MADVLTTVFGFVKQTIGGNRNTWGGILNANFDLVEAGLAGKTDLAVSGGSVTLTDEQRRVAIISITGTLASNQTVVVPNDSAKWRVRNATTGDFTVKFKTASGTAVEVPQGGECTVRCDGDDGIHVGLSTVWRDTQIGAPDGTDDLPGISFASEINSGFRRVSLGLIALVVGGVQLVKWSGTTLLAEFADAGITFHKALEVPDLTINGERPIPVGGSMDYEGIRAPNGWLFRYGQAVSRETYADLLAALSETATATRNGTTGLSSVSKDLTGLGLEGAVIEGTGIATGTTIVSLTATTITLSAAASGSGATSVRIFPHGQGDASTTFNIPDDRGRNSVGRDNMGGTSANRLTGQTGGIDGDKLGSAGGAETDTLTTAKIPSHNHTVTDPGHFHRQNIASSPGGSNDATGADPTNVDSTPQDSGFNTDSKTTGITLAAAGGDGAHNNVQPGRVVNKIIFTGVYS